MKSVVEVIIGSISDKEKVSPALEMLDKFEIGYNFYVASAHRSPELVNDIAITAKERDIKVIIAAAGYSAHLAGSIASLTLIPVIGLPLSSSTLNGMDSLFSTVQMPAGVPVATVGIDGAANAAFLALEILAVNDDELYDKLLQYRIEEEKNITDLNEQL